MGVEWHISEKGQMKLAWYIQLYFVQRYNGARGHCLLNGSASARVDFAACLIISALWCRDRLSSVIQTVVNQCKSYQSDDSDPNG